jgi:hypothetical protein
VLNAVISAAVNAGGGRRTRTPNFVVIYRSPTGQRIRTFPLKNHNVRRRAA